MLLGRRSDPGLTERGLGQALALGRALRDDGLKDDRPTIVTSPLRRCRETAEVIATCFGVDPAELVTEPRLAEIDYGEWEGVPLSEIQPVALSAWREDPEFRPPGGESLAEVSARVGEWCAQQTGVGTLIAVTHVSPIKAGVIWALDGSPTLAWRLHVGVASITTLSVSASGGPALLAFNESRHLRGS